jgi:DNA-binding transcriptional regulator YiaG
MRDLLNVLRDGTPVEKKFTARVVALDLEPRDFDGDEIRKIRKRLHVSQAIFARFIGASVKTIASWEQGKRNPTFMARRLLEFMRVDRKLLRSMLVETAAEAHDWGMREDNRGADGDVCDRRTLIPR